MNRGVVKLAMDRAIAHDLLDVADLIETLASETDAIREDRDHNYQNWVQALDRNHGLLVELAALRKEADKFEDGIDWIQRAMQPYWELAPWTRTKNCASSSRSRT